MRKIMSARLLAGASLGALIATTANAQQQAAVLIDEIVVTGSREATLRFETPSSISVIGGNAIDRVRPAHPSEILGRVPGVAIQQTNGEGHITGIRQPIGTAPLYLYLEDGVPVRASGFFNHNALYEINLPQSGGIEVTRGPGTALQGSDAIGGIVNAITRAPSETPEAAITLEGGSYTWLRALGSVSNTWGDFGLRGDVNVTHSDGWRDTTAYDRQSVTFRADKTLSGNSRLKAIFSASNIEQETGANSAVSLADYENNPTVNYMPIAFRKVQSARASVEWEQTGVHSLVSLIPYFRWSTMDLLPTFMLNFDPVDYTTGYYSTGLLAKYRYDFEPMRTRFITGVDLDYSPGSRQEDRITATRTSGIFTSFTNLGRIYDYDVTFWQASPYVQVEASPLPDLRMTAGLRVDAVGFKYDNLLSDGGFVTPTPSGNRTFFRPADTNVDYTHAGPSLGATYSFTPSFNAFVSYKNSFRVPQESQLFRPGTNFGSLDLKPVEADSYEAGLRGFIGETFKWDVSVYRMNKSNDILTLTLGNVPSQTNNGKTRHTGVEAQIAWDITPEWTVAAAGSYSEQFYREWVVSATNTLTGKEMSAAPREIANVTAGYTPTWAAGLNIEGELVYQGSYWMDDANTRKYGGHELVNLRVNYDIDDGLTVFARATNLFDVRWATSASISGGQPQFAPGLPLTLYGGIKKRF